MSDKVKKILLYLSFMLLCVLIFLGSLHSLIDVKEIKEVTKNSIERAFPNLSVEFSELDYTLSTSLKLFGKDLVVKLKKRHLDTDIETLCKIKSFELKIPLLALVFNGGSLRLTGHFPEFNFEQYEENNNWKQALLEQKLYKELEVLSFVANSRLNFIFYHSELNYKIKGDDFKTIGLQKVVVKDLNSSSTTAFEISSDLDIDLGKSKKLESRLLAIGQLNMKRYLSDNTLESFIVTKFTDLKYTGFSGVVPPMQNSINLTLRKDGTSDVKVDTKVGQILDFSAQGNYKNGDITVSSTSISTSLKELVSILGDNAKKKLSYLELKNSKLIVEGSINYSKELDSFTPNLKFKTDREFGIGLPYSINFNNTLTGGLNGKQLNVSLISNLFDGIITTDLSTNFEYFYKTKKISFLDGYDAKVSANSIKLEKVNFRDIFYSSVNDEQSVYTGSVSKKRLLRKRYPYLLGDIQLDLRDMFINDNKISLKGKLAIHPFSIVSKDLKFSIGKGSGDLAYYLHRDEDNIKTTKIDSSFKDAPLSAINLFLPDYFKDYTGLMTGELGTQIIRDYENEIANSYARVTVKDGKFSSIDVDQYVTKFLKENNFFKKRNSRDLIDIIKDLNFDGNFSKLFLDADMENGLASIRSLKLEDKRDRFELKGTGTLYLKDRDKKSELELNAKYKNSKASDYLTRIIGTSNFPLLLRGEGLELLPYVNFTIEKLLANSMKGRTGKFIDSDKFKKMLKDNNIIINPKLLKGLK